MKRPEFLIGGKKAPAKPRGAGVADDTPPPQVGWRFLLALILVAGAFSALGAMRVHQVFAARNFRIEASRLQQDMRRHEDRNVEISARIAQLQRAELLSSAGQEAFGMNSPEPAFVERIEIGWEARQRWASAAQAAAVSKVKEEMP